MALWRVAQTLWWPQGSHTLPHTQDHKPPGCPRDPKDLQEVTQLFPFGVSVLSRGFLDTGRTRSLLSLDSQKKISLRVQTRWEFRPPGIPPYTERYISGGGGEQAERLRGSQLQQQNLGCWRMRRTCPSQNCSPRLSGSSLISGPFHCCKTRS